jgi:ribosomal protein S18 acetylase RimI-like enzyme
MTSTRLPASDLGVRKATGADLPAVVETLTAAFFDDQFFVWWVPDPWRRRQLLPPYFEITVDLNHPHGEIYTAAPVPAAAAVWIPPEHQPVGEAAGEMLAAYAEAADETAERLVTAFTLMDEVHPTQPHAYLFLLGTRPPWQNQGLGSALLREVLEWCDRDRIPAYLEASSAANQRLYQRHGFEVTGEIVLPHGPSLWPMWREPERPGTQR